METNKQKDKFYKKKSFWIVGFILLIVLLVVIYLIIPIKIVSICTKMDSHDKPGACLERKTVLIVAKPKLPSECPTGTEAVFDEVGGFVGLKYVGCTRDE